MLAEIHTSFEDAQRGPLGEPLLDKLFEEDPGCHYYRMMYHLCCRIAARESSVLAVELGVCTGRGTAHIAAGCAPHGAVFGVDPAPYDLAHILPTYPNICLLKDKSDAPAVLQHFTDGSVDLCFVDSVHSPDYTLREVALWTPKMKPGGIFLFDDLQLDDGMKTVLPRLPFAVKGLLEGMHLTNAFGDVGFGYGVV